MHDFEAEASSKASCRTVHTCSDCIDTFSPRCPSACIHNVRFQSTSYPIPGARSRCSSVCGECLVQRSQRSRHRRPTRNRNREHGEHGLPASRDRSRHACSLLQSRSCGGVSIDRHPGEPAARTSGSAAAEIGFKSSATASSYRRQYGWCGDCCSDGRRASESFRSSCTARDWRCRRWSWSWNRRYSGRCGWARWYS